MVGSPAICNIVFIGGMLFTHRSGAYHSEYDFFWYYCGQLDPRASYMRSSREKYDMIFVLAWAGSELQVHTGRVCQEGMDPRTRHRRSLFVLRSSYSTSLHG